MKKTKLTVKDIKLINHALDICASDYDVMDESNPESYRVKMLKAIDKLKTKLIKISCKTTL